MITIAFMTYSKYNSNFIKGVDVSMLKELENHGTKFYDENNKEAECMSILKNYGVNWIRIRTNPRDKDENALGGGNNNKETTIELVKQAKSLGMNVLLDFYYSDFWASPSKQFKPKTWEGISDKEINISLLK